MKCHRQPGRETCRPAKDGRLNTILSENVFERTCWQKWNRRILFCVINSASVKVIFKANFETAILGEWSMTRTPSQNTAPRNIEVVTDVVTEG
jgi:hypothetical protein